MMVVRIPKLEKHLLKGNSSGKYPKLEKAFTMIGDDSGKNLKVWKKSI